MWLWGMVSHHYCGVIGKSIGEKMVLVLVMVLYQCNGGLSKSIGYMVLVLVSTIVKVLESQ